MPSTTIIIAGLVALAAATAAWTPPRVSVVAVDGLWIELGNSRKPPGFTHTQLADAASKGFTFIRVAGTAFWPDELREYESNHTAYMGAVHRLFHAANATGCRLLVSVFWNWFAVPDLVGEPLGAAMRNTSSATRAFMRRYLSDITAAAAEYPDSVAGWELGNELSNLADLNMSGRTSSIAQHLGTPTVRTSADNFSTSDMIAFDTWLAAETRAAATTAATARGVVLSTVVSTGHSTPRPAAYHLRMSYHDPRRDWTPDTEAQFEQILIDTTSCCELASVHFYPGDGARFHHTDVNGTYPLVVAQRAMRSVNRTLYVGEFGNKDNGPRTFTHTVLHTLKAHNISLATLWVWEFYQRSATEMAPFSIRPGQEDEGIIRAMQDLNNDGTV